MHIKQNKIIQVITTGTQKNIEPVGFHKALS